MIQFLKPYKYILKLELMDKDNKSDNKANSKAKDNIYIPQEFWCNLDPGLALPIETLIALNPWIFKREVTKDKPNRRG